MYFTASGAACPKYLTVISLIICTRYGNEYVYILKKFRIMAK
jgi:hypothetical protein